jgi:serine/threonine-protein phosphatase 2A regulatory subunit A
VRKHSHGFALASTDSLAESVEDEDEVLTALSDELGGFVEYVGGPDFGHCLLSPLENLATIEEPLVRDKVRERIS